MAVAGGTSVVAASSVTWFVEYLRLHNRGVIPTVTPNCFMPSRKALSEYWGPRTPEGYMFSDQGIPAYEMYVIDLFSRVLQLPWPVGGVLPYHFARALLVEALGVEVNWAEFAYRSTHPHQSNSRIPRILPEFKTLKAPLPPLAIVMPRVHLSRSSPLAATLARHLNEGGNSARLEVPASAEERCRVPIHLAPPDAGFPKLTGDGALFVKNEVPKNDSTPAIGFEGGDLMREFDARGSLTMDVDAVSALVILRPDVTGALENERNRLRMAKRELSESVQKIRHTLNEQTERQNSVEQKIAEKYRTHKRASAQLRRARAALNSAKLEAVVTSLKAPVSNNSVKVCEQLLDAWVENVVIAQRQLESWELKLKGQRERVRQTQTELTMAEALMMEKTGLLDTSLAQLQALDSTLANL